MAEIKSTLDIIMERTRGLRMTGDEKRAFRGQETAGKIKGLVQKCLDGAIDLVRFQGQVTVLRKEVRDEVMVGRLLGEECLDRIELGRDYTVITLSDTCIAVTMSSMLVVSPTLFCSRRLK
jgi:hypothetical protein